MTMHTNQEQSAAADTVERTEEAAHADRTATEALGEWPRYGCPIHGVQE